MFRTRAPELVLPQHLAGWVAAARRARPAEGALRRLINAIELTCLDDTDEAGVDTLCRRALTPAGQVAAVCVEPRFVPVARRRLERTGIPVTTVVNFPEGDGYPRTVRDEVKYALADGAQAIAAVFPYRAFLAGDRAAGPALIVAAKTECGPDVPLTVVLETGAFPDSDRLAEAARVAVAEGADFLGTTTGKSRLGSTPEAAAILLEAILAVRYGNLRGGGKVGLSVTGGVDTTAQAVPYLALAEIAIGRGWATPETFRVGSGPLLDDVLAALGAAARPRH